MEIVHLFKGWLHLVKILLHLKEEEEKKILKFIEFLGPQEDRLKESQSW